MADLTTVRPLIAAALDEADTALGNQTVTAQLAAKDAQIQQLASDLAKERDKITRMVAKLDTLDSTDSAADQARADIRAIVAE